MAFDEVGSSDSTGGAQERLARIGMQVPIHVAKAISGVVVPDSAFTLLPKVDQPLPSGETAASAAPDENLVGRAVDVEDVARSEVAGELWGIGAHLLALLLLGFGGDGGGRPSFSGLDLVREDPDPPAGGLSYFTLQ